MLQATAQSPSSSLRTSDGRTRFTQYMSYARDTVDIWMERVRTRRALLTLDDRMLQDIGVSRADACNEAEKPFWQR